MPTVQYPLLAGADLRRETTLRILEDLNRLRAFTEPREARLRNVPGIRSTLRHLPVFSPMGVYSTACPPLRT